jgi:uncharacterized protein
MASLPADANQSPQSHRSSERIFEKLTDWQVGHPARVLFAVALLTLITTVCALRLKLLTGFEHLLPEGRPSVQELHRVAAKTAGVSTLFVVLKAGDGPSGPAPREALRKASDTLVVELGKVGSPWVGSVENGVKDAVDFISPRAGLYADLGELEKLRDDIQARFEYEVTKQLGTQLDDEPPPAIDAAVIEQRFGKAQSQAQRYPDGYYESQDGKVNVVAIRSKILGSDLERGTIAIARVRETIERANLASFHPSIQYGLAGDLYSGTTEVAAIHRDLTQVGYIGVALIIGIVFVYYLRIRTVFTMLLTIFIGVSWTFGVTFVTIGHLNVATGFLFTIVIGNGINTGIIYMARYLEARRKGASLRDGVLIAHRETWLPTLTAAAAAAAAYGSLVTTEFRGFRDFGVIGGVGMMLCWVASYLAMPSLLAVIERFAPLDRESGGILSRIRRVWGSAFGRPFAAVLPLAPRAITIFGIATAAAGIIGIVRYVRSDPMEYNMQNLRNHVETRAEEAALKKLADEITGYVGADAMAILVAQPEQVALLRTALYAKRDAAPPDRKPFDAIHAIQDFVPGGQAEKIPVLLEIKDKVVRAHRRGIVPEADWKKIAPFLPPDDLKPFTMANLPDAMARPFMEDDGTRGRIVYISPSGDVDDARYLFDWADSYRRTELSDQSTVLGSGRAVIYADMWTAVIEAVPGAVGFSLFGTLLVVMIAFRAGKLALAVVGALLVGVAWLAVLLVLLGIKLNFLNFIALPITFGIGVDYAVNIVQRYSREGADGALTAVRETGGAVVLCSLTTTLGYLALCGSMNYAVRSLGIAAVLGEVCCLAAAMLVLPAGLVWLERARKRAASDPPQAAASELPG